MYYKTSDQWQASNARRILFFGMSGLGKTHVSNILRETGNWFHYSVDYRIGTRYMGEHIVDNFKAHAMQMPFLRDLLRSDSIHIASNITFENLAPLSTYMGKPGNPEKGGISFDEYKMRQEQHRMAEIAALLDTPYFIDRAQKLYGYDNFVCDSGGSICEVVTPDDPLDSVLTALSENMLLVWIKGDDTHTEELVKRFSAAPKPMYFGAEFLDDLWARYCRENNQLEADVDPDAFMIWAYRQCLDHRLPRYQAIAQNWGITVNARDIAEVRDCADLDHMISSALAKN